MKLKTALIAATSAFLPATHALAHPGSHDHIGAGSIIAHLAGLAGWFVALAAIVYFAKRRSVDSAGRQARRVAVRTPERTGRK